jgi:hypothetical protein
MESPGGGGSVDSVGDAQEGKERSASVRPQLLAPGATDEKQESKRCVDVFVDVCVYVCIYKYIYIYICIYIYIHTRVHDI